MAFSMAKVAKHLRGIVRIPPYWRSFTPRDPPEDEVLCIRLITSPPFEGTDGPWLQEVTVSAVFNKSCVAFCTALLIKEEHYISDHVHFFNAMDDAGGDPMSDLAHLILWSEQRWITLRNLKMDRITKTRLRPALNARCRHMAGEIPRYCQPRLYKPKPGTPGLYAIPPKRTWALYFNYIEVQHDFRRYGIGWEMVRMALEQVHLRARGANRHLLAAVQPQLLYTLNLVIDRDHQQQERGVVESQQFWLAMGFQKFIKSQADGSNWYFWSDSFTLPKERDIHNGDDLNMNMEYGTLGFDMDTEDNSD
ncbi:hypothetical protein J7T55_007232 [Diaporthe amygdali]|uniref:uncharacterized protein n=1 Tax=Phomopsis amygdali TaxID=1214568 RepID=UPI0022FDF37F|nr:uncharacterized protein J7T55_007232 [Diaporthe amygdali]KAJ0108113.1 hypothetical protein J7T55_007232 [Diaporthe amygdali]